MELGCSICQKYNLKYGMGCSLLLVDDNDSAVRIVFKSHKYRRITNSAISKRNYGVRGPFLQRSSSEIPDRTENEESRTGWNSIRRCSKQFRRELLLNSSPPLNDLRALCLISHILLRAFVVVLIQRFLTMDNSE